MYSNGIAANEPRGVLVVRLGAMGDIIHTLPAVARLRQAFPRARIVWAVEPRWKPLLSENPAVDEVIEVPLSRWRKSAFSPVTWREVWSLRQALRQQKFDVAIDFQGLLKSALVALASGAERIVGFDRGQVREGVAANLYSHRVAPQAAHVVDKNLALANALSGRRRISSRPPEFPLPMGIAEPSLPNEDFVLASPLAGWRSKQWPEQHWASLAALIWRESGMPLVLDTAPADAGVVNSIAAAAPPLSCRIHLSSLEGLIAATRRARAVIGLDSGPMHLAAALEKPGVAIFGPTDPTRNGPYGRSVAILRSSTAETSYKRRKQIDPAMQLISPEEVWQALEPRLVKTGLAPLVAPG